MSLRADLRYSVRTLRRDPRTAVLVILCIALAIGVNSSMFSLVRAVFLRPLPVEDPHELVTLYSKHPGFDYASFSYLNYQDVQERNESLAGINAATFVPVSLAAEGRSDRLFTLLASGNYFQVLGVQPAQGRFFGPSEDQAEGAHPVVVLSYGVWRSRFAGDPGIVGQQIKINGYALDVIGVAPRGFRGTAQLFEPDLYIPIAMHNEVAPTYNFDRRGYEFLFLNGRLKEGVTYEQARQDLDRVAESIVEDDPEGMEGYGILTVADGRTDRPPHVASFLPASSALVMAVVFMVLLIACANVAGLLMARSLARTRETSIRLALGAGRGRLIRQLLTESLLLATAGGVAGLGLAFALGRWLPLTLPPLAFPVAFGFTPDASVLVFTLVLTVATGLIFGLMPALQSSRVDLVPALKGQESPGAAGRSGRQGLRSALVVVQVALSAVLLVGSGLFIRSLQQAQQIDPGFETKGVLLAGFDPSMHGYSTEEGLAFYEELIREVAALPGVAAVSSSDSVPLGLLAGGQQRTVSIEGYQPAEGERMNPDYAQVREGYFELMGIPMVAGRTFRASDDAEGAPVIVVNQAMAERFWPGGQALGRRVGVAGEDREVIGIARDSKLRTLGEKPESYFYLAHRQVYAADQVLHVKVASEMGAQVEPYSLSGPVRDIARQLDPDLAVFDIRTLEDETSFGLFLPRFGAGLMGGFGALALVLAAIGLYGLLAHAVGRRRHEIGVRMAIGADRSSIFRLVLRFGLALTLTGLALGLILAAVVGRTLSSFLYGLSTTDAVTFSAVAILLLGTALAAVTFPARRAMAVDPIKALREE